MTDHGNMFGAIEFYREASHGIKPIIGCEIYVAPTSRFEKKGVDKGPKEYNNHLILLAMNNEGYRNLCKLVSLGYMEGFYYKPRIDKELLQRTQRRIDRAQRLLARAKCRRRSTTATMKRPKPPPKHYASIFGDRYYIEIQDNKLRGAGESQSAAGRIGQGTFDSGGRDQRLSLRRARGFSRPRCACFACRLARR